MVGDRLNVLGDVSPNLVMKLKRLGKIITDISDEEFKIQMALGVVPSSPFIIRTYKII